MVLKSILVQNKKTNDKTMNGPNGIAFSLFFIKINNEMGKAITLANNKTIMLISGLKIKPIIKKSFISAPPKVSFLKILLPRSETKYQKDIRYYHIVNITYNDNTQKTY